MKKKLCWLSFGFTVLLVATIFLSCREREAVSAQSFLNLLPSDTFMYLGFNDWKILRDDTGAFDFLKTARRLKVGAQLRQFFEKEKKVTPQLRETTRRLEKLRDKVSLWDLFGGEVALAAFPLEGGEKPVLVFLCRLPEGKNKLYRSCFEDLLGLFAGEEKRETNTSTYLGESLTSFSLPGLQIESRPTWCTVEDVFILTSRPEGTREIVHRLKGKNRGDSLIFNPGFQKAFTDFNPAEQGVIFIRSDDFIDWGRKIFHYQKFRLEKRFKGEGPKAGFRPPPARQLIYCLKALAKIAGTTDIVAGNFGLSREGYWGKIRCYLDEEEGSQALLAVLKSPPRQWDVLDYIPAGAPGLEVGFLEVEKVYRPLLNYITDTPGYGKVIAEKWEEWQEKSGFNLEEDLFPWLGDEYAACTVSLSKSMTDPGSFAFFWKVTSESGMEASLDKLIASAREKSRASLNIIEEEYEGCNIRVAYLPLPLLSVTPTLGKVGDYLVLASRKEAFKSIVDTYRKRTKSIRQAPDFIRMRERLGDRGTNFSFSCLEERIDATITILRSVASLFGMTVALGNPQTPEEEEEQNSYLEKVNLLNDLARVLEDLRVFKFFGRISRFTGEYIELQEFIEIERRGSK